jgi:hypothetical protein
MTILSSKRRRKGNHTAAAVAVATAATSSSSVESLRAVSGYGDKKGSQASFCFCCIKLFLIRSFLVCFIPQSIIVIDVVCCLVFEFPLALFVSCSRCGFGGCTRRQASLLAGSVFA